MNPGSRTVVFDPNNCSIQEPQPAPPEPCTQSPFSMEQCEQPIQPEQNYALPASRSEAAAPRGILKNKGAVPCPCEDMTTIGRQPPGTIDPITAVPVPNELRPVIQGTTPCYLPQPEDQLIVNSTEGMGPIGPWATGRVDWGPLAGLTGTRPVVDRYSISRFSEGEWRQHNKEMLDMAGVEQHKSNLY